MAWNLLAGYEGKKHIINVNGHAVEAVVTIKWDYEDSYPVIGQDFDFEDETDNLNYAKSFEVGQNLNIMISVVARSEGLESLDHLGCCHIDAKNFNADILDVVDCHGMIENALIGLTGEILDASGRLDRFSVKGQDFIDIAEKCTGVSK